MEPTTKTQASPTPPNQSQPVAPATPTTAKPKRNMFPIILGVLVLGGATFGINKYIHALHHEETDDAQVDAFISPVIPRVAGYVEQVKVTDNQQVKKGDTLLVLDNRDYIIKLEQAEAGLISSQGSLGFAEATTVASQANTSTVQANVGVIDAQIDVAKITLQRATQDFDRSANLIKDKSITQQQYDQALAAKQTAERQLSVLREQRNAAARQSNAAASTRTATGRQVSVANATIRQKKAEIESARLNLSYTVITAASDGRVSKVPVQPGQYVNAGQQLFSIVRETGLWVTANFKETQLEKMKPGQKVTIHADAYPGHAFEAHVASFAPATGARFSILPPDNASGNFVKVVQRVPVRIEFDNPNEPELKMLRAGLNVGVDVHLD